MRRIGGEILERKQFDDLLLDNPLSLIDIIITQFAKEIDDEDSYNTLSDYFLNAIIKYLDIEYVSGNLENAIFNNELRESYQKFIAVCLLRLLSSNDNFFPSKSAFRNKTFVLFDNVFSSDIYKNKDVNLSPNDQSYIKQSKLVDFLLRYEKTITESFNITGLNMLDSFKKKFYSTINSQINNIIISPFLPQSLIDKYSLKELFDSISEYINSSDKYKIDNYAKTVDILEQYVLEAREFKTNYSKKFFEESFNRIYSMIKSDFENSPLSKPADLSLNQTEKKYPFNILGAKFRISIFVRNNGKGHAFSTDVRIDAYEDSIRFIKTQRHIGDISTDVMLVGFDCEVLKPEKYQLIDFKINWRDFNNTFQSRNFLFEFQGQNHNVDWDSLKYEEPYTWEPVDTEEKLVGRREILDRLWTSIVMKDKISSFYIYGQKRVGKTSIVKTLNTKIQRDMNNNFIVLYIEGGEYKDLSLSKTIQNLGEIICLKIRDCDKRFSGIEIPKFDGALSPLTRFLDKVALISPDIRMLFILDEFDEISSEIFRRGEIADSLFLTIRAISNKTKYGFLLVGGEKMDFIISCQGEQLNKFQSIRVDYFDKENYWDDFQDLVSRPVKKTLEITDKALGYLYNKTSGNPFFTSIVCAKLFTIMVERRDTHVTELEMEQAVKQIIETNGTQIFSHFWEDRIKWKEEKEEEISITRRKILISIARTLIKYGEAKREDVVDDIIKNGITENIAIDNLKEFIERQILVELPDNKYYFKINIFEKWLIEKGISAIITTLSDSERIRQVNIIEEDAKVKSEEVIELLKNWYPYDGREITSDLIRQWLNQFGENTKQRLMFKILQNITFYCDYNIKQKMKEMYKYILENERLVWRQEEGKKKRDDILVSYLENNISKSGIEYARIFTDHNNIYATNAIEKEKIVHTIKQSSNIKVLLFVDDFVGTGNSISTNLENFVNNNPDFKELNIKVYIGVITGFIDAKDKILQQCTELEINADVFICNPLHDENKCFNDRASIFSSQNERMLAKDICYEYGVKLVKDNPYGYGNCQATVIFPNTCPNNCLPILWAKNEKWVPLFLRKV